MTWLLDTLVWTGTLIALVMALRGPFARAFGPGAAYVLWALPVMRLFLPPIELPAWLAPQAAAAPLVALPAGLTAGETVGTTTTTYLASASAAPSIDWTALLIAIWLGGAAATVALRLHAYRAFRRDMLADARSVGEAGGIRLVETPATRSPVAFGIIDPVVALPPAFMAQGDRLARDLALAHELAHHRGFDLVANFAALPLFALHWFNPLGHLGWRAMRRDQEAVCDARVMAGTHRADRARYATLISRTAAGPSGALAAPMACRVLGEKSIVHRLRSLTLTDLSPRRRRSGGWLIGAAALALPLTASITYAQAEAPPAPPAPPAAPEAPLPPAAPDAPEPPLAPDATRIVIDEKSPDGKEKERRVMVFRSADGSAKPAEPHRIEKRIVMRVPQGSPPGWDAKAFEKDMKNLDVELRQLDGEKQRIVMIERHARAAEASAHAAEAHARAMARADIAMRAAPTVVASCDEGGSETRSQDGRRVIRICKSKIYGSALAGLRSARDRIQKDDNLSAEVRAEVLRSLDAEIERMGKSGE